MVFPYVCAVSADWNFQKQMAWKFWRIWLGHPLLKVYETYYLIIVVEMMIECERRLGGVQPSIASPSSHTDCLMCSFTYSFKQFLVFSPLWLFSSIKARVSFFLFCVKYYIIFVNIDFTFWVQTISETQYILVWSNISSQNNFLEG